MPKKINDKKRSIFVKFYQDVSEEEIIKEIKKLGVYGVSVSNLLNRWVLEVPFWKEEKYRNLLLSNDIVEKVHESYNMRKQPSYQEEEYYE